MVNERMNIFTLDPLSTRVLGIFRLFDRESLDLHALFEAGGNETAERTEVLDAVEGLVRQGLLEAQGGDFYGLTEKGKRVFRV